MKSGADIDILTGRPIEQVTSTRETERLGRDEAILKAKAEFMGMTTSPDGKKLIALVQSHLNTRIAAMVTNDPEAQCLVKLLADLGMKENEAKKATERLTALRIKKE
jgi:hypothetical protein